MAGIAGLIELQWTVIRQVVGRAIVLDQGQEEREIGVPDWRS